MISDGASAGVASALAATRRARHEVAAALERVLAAGAGAWEGTAAELSAGRLRRLAAEALDVLDDAIQVCERAPGHPLGTLPQAPPTSRAIG